MPQENGVSSPGLGSRASGPTVRRPRSSPACLGSGFFPDRGCGVSAFSEEAPAPSFQDTGISALGELCGVLWSSPGHGEGLAPSHRAGWPNWVRSGGKHTLHSGPCSGLSPAWTARWRSKHCFQWKPRPHSGERKCLCPRGMLCGCCVSACLLNCFQAPYGRPLEWFLWCCSKRFFFQKLSPQTGQRCRRPTQEEISWKPGRPRVLGLGTPSGEL